MTPDHSLERMVASPLSLQVITNGSGSEPEFGVEGALEMEMEGALTETLEMGKFLSLFCFDLDLDWEELTPFWNHCNPSNIT